MRLITVAGLICGLLVSLMFAFPRAGRTQGSSGPDPAGIRIRTEQVVRGLEFPVAVTHAGDGSGRLFVIEKRGRIRIIKGGQLLTTPFLDITDRVRPGGSQDSEQGLLGLVFHPRYEENGFFYVDYTTNAAGRTGDTVIARFQVTADADWANSQSEKQILTFDQPQVNHNGGQVEFGPDGFLYIGNGDGGGGGDQHGPIGNGQNGGTLLGKILRLDVDGGDPYAIPPTNPFVGNPDFLDEIWAYGLRNPWRFSFDKATGDLYIGDVGQNQWEEIDFQPATSTGGENYGWRVMEGTHCFNPSSGCDQSGKVLPIAEYRHANGNCSVTGGYVYRGQRYPGFVGAYFYADYCTGITWAMSRDDAGRWRNAEVGNAGIQVSSFGEGEDGEVYLAGGNQVLRLADANAPSATPGGTTATPTTPAPTTPAPSATPSPTRTRTPTRSATPIEPTPTGVSTPRPAYLPFLALRETRSILAREGDGG